MRLLKIDVLYSQDVVVWDNLRLPMQEMSNKFTDFHAMAENASDSTPVKQQMKRLTVEI